MIPFLSNLAIILGAILFACFSWRKIELGIYAIVFCLPLYLVRFNIFGIPSTALELGIYILFIIWLAKNYRRIKLREIIPDKTLEAGIILLLAGAVISAVFSHDLKISAGILKGWFIDPFLFFIILVSEIKAFERKANLLKSLFLSGLAVAAASLVFWFFPELNSVSYDGRLHGFYASPNYLAMYLAPILIIGIWLIFLSLRGSSNDSLVPAQGKLRNLNFGYRLLPSLQPLAPLDSKIFQLNIFNMNHPTGLAMANKYFWLVSVLIISTAMYFTYSYAAWFSFFAAILLFFYLALPDFKKRFFTSAIVFLIFAAMVLAQGGTDKFSDLKNLSYRSSYNSRLMIWRSAWEIGKDHWLVGIGPGNFQKYYLAYQSRVLGIEPYLEWAVPEPHNIFLAFWLEAGVLGFFGFLALLAWFFQRGLSLLSLSLRGAEATKQSNNLLTSKMEIASLPEPAPSKIEGVARNDRKDHFPSQYYLLVAVLISLMVYTALHGLFDTTYWKNDLAIIFWVLLGLMAETKNSQINQLA